MARNTTNTDIDALGASVTERFDGVAWEMFNGTDRAARSETRHEVLRIRDDLMKIADVDPHRAARIWDGRVPTFVPRPFELPTVEPDPVVFNTIEPGRKRRRTNPELYLEGGPTSTSISNDREVSPGGDRAPVNTKVPAVQEMAVGHRDPNAERIKLLLGGLNNQYLKADDKYHFRDKGGDVAFEVQEKKLITQHDTPAVVSSMIDLAETRGWSSLKLTGTEEFKREAWLQASLRDFEVSGYRPDKLDKVRLEELRAERAIQKPSNRIEPHSPVSSKRIEGPVQFEVIDAPVTPEAALSLTPAQDQFVRLMEATMRHRGDRPETIARARALADERLTSDRVHVGTLVSVGTAPYQDKRGAAHSHFIELQSDHGEKTKVWGVDLPRALEAAGAEPGQMVAVAFRGRQRVTVDVAVRNEKGEKLGTEKKDVDRNTWEVVRFDKLREDAKVSVLKAVERQENPAALKIFDRSARPEIPKPGVSRHIQRGRERTR
jgi:hypothetical protein